MQNRLERYPQVTEANVRRALTQSLLLIEADAKVNVRQDTRRLAGSINHQITGAFPDLVGRVGPSVKYGAVVEFGRRPGSRMPPVDALLGWVRRHFSPGATAVAAGPARGRAWRAAGEHALRSRAFALARAIARRGIPARPFLVPAYRKNQPAIEALFAQVGVRLTAYLAGGPPL